MAASCACRRAAPRTKLTQPKVAKLHGKSAVRSSTAVFRMISICYLRPHQLIRRRRYQLATAPTGAPRLWSRRCLLCALRTLPLAPDFTRRRRRQAPPLVRHVSKLRVRLGCTGRPGVPQWLPRGRLIATNPALWRGSRAPYLKRRRLSLLQNCRAVVTAWRVGDIV
jgi:hypothetical protein